MNEIITNGFIEEIIANDLASGKHDSIYTRFPPEPNGYLHIGHAKSLSINFGAKEKFNGRCNLRFDDTNPTKEDVEYVNSIKEDIKWLGYSWDKELYASDYFDIMYNCAIELIEKGLAYVCDMSAQEMHDTRGTLKEAGIPSPARQRSVDENLTLFAEMKAGKYSDGEKILRARIDMASPNMNMRDPALYRIVKATHHRTGDKWCIYPMYDFAHPIEDAIEGITHSLCTLEFEDHRPLYNWVIENCTLPAVPRQIEFARLNLTRTIMSKRYLLKLVEDGIVKSWSDPRMPTISGMRERGYPAYAIKDFCTRIGVAKANSEVDVKLLEHCVREYLNEHAERAMVVTDAIILNIINLSDDEVHEFEVSNHPYDESKGNHIVKLTNKIYIESDDFMVDAPRKYYRLKPEGIVRLKGAYILEYVSHSTDDEGRVISVDCKYIEDSQSGGVNAGLKCKGVIHWVSVPYSVEVTINEYDYLLTEVTEDNPNGRINPNSLSVYKGYAEEYIRLSKPYDRYQFMRKGYYMISPESNKEEIVINQIVSLKDSFKVNLSS